MTKQSSSSDDGSLNIAFFSVLFVAFSLLFIFLEGGAIPEEGEKEMAVLSPLESALKKDLKSEDSISGNGYLLATSPPTYHKPQVLAVKTEDKNEKENHKEEENEPVVKKVLYVEATGYSSTVDQTNCQPFITASGTWVRDGIVAANFLDFGTKIRIPQYFGDKEFVVKDRMNSRFSPPYNGISHDGYIDIWFPTRWEATNFGRVRTQIEILQ